MTSSAFVAVPHDPLGGDALLELARSAALAELFLASIAITAALLARRPIRRTLGLMPTRMRWRDVALVCVGTLALSHALDTALASTGWIEHSVLKELPAQLEGASGVRLVIALIALALLPAFAEEMLCRGWIQRSLVARIGPALGIAASALIFGLLHIDPVHMVVATALGLYLGWIAHWAGSIWPSIVCHGVNNAAAVLAAVELSPNPGNLWTLGSCLLAAGAALAWVATRAAPSPPSGE